MNNIRVASVQFEHVAGDKAANFDTIRGFVEQASEQRVELIVFPECCVSGYWHLRNLSRDELLDLAEPIPSGPTTQALLDLSRKHNMTIGAGFIEVDVTSGGGGGVEGQLFNSYVVAMPDGTWRCHRKLHCFINGECLSGSEYTVFDTPHGCRVAVLICYDNNLVENARMCALQGAEILLAPHQTGGCDTPSPHAMGTIDPQLWRDRNNSAEARAAIEAEIAGDKGRGWLMRWLPARAHDNGMFLIFSNGVGVDDNEVRTGNATIFDPYGRVIASTDVADDAMIVADLDTQLRHECTGQRWLRARRPDLYAPLTVPTGIERDVRTVRFEKRPLQ